MAKKKSRRLSVKMKNKIVKKVNEHHRKLRKEDKEKGKVKKTIKKDPGIPNLYPFKEDLLNQIQAHKDAIAEVRRLKKEGKKARSVSDLVKQAGDREKEFTKKQKEAAANPNQLDRTSAMESRDNSLRSFFREVKKVIEASDVILQVLDARDPMGCRCLDVEKLILERYPNKKIVLILNKIDLIPKDNVLVWVKYLKNYFPTLAFKCSTMQHKITPGQSHVSAELATQNQLNSAECYGGESLLQLLKNYSRSLNMKTSISVGIIGYPNVGKSSLINSLKRARSVSVANTPGHTKVAQVVNLDKNVKLIDSPGIVPLKGGIDVNTVLRNVVRVEKVEDPVTPVTAIIQRCGRNQLIKIYQVPNFTSTTEFLTLIAHRRGKIKAGGIIDLHATALSVLRDWTDGKIPFHTVPPKENHHVGASIVSNFDEEFNIDQSADLENLRDKVDSTAVASMETKVDTSIFDEEDDEDMDEDDDSDEDDSDMDDDDEDEDEDEDDDSLDGADMEEGDDEQVDIRALLKQQQDQKLTQQQQRNQVKTAKKQNLTDEADQYNPQTNKNAKKQAKKEKKKAGFVSQEAYSFATDFVGSDDESADEMHDDNVEEDIDEDEVF
ncbi:guanine nucleotide binding protein 3 [Cavenderia fasciculata]|uniref:Guanine nucleotide binding protein 3 n=1 Tax=Cavenderia fasciculata TaxID=261658 RepID=F4PVT6_CACFS|nr:guanine nucleotide binding protein 3 [Cavenderia fasciculata]EGG20100.1 guanine nucleotide binding protein 3 [Cavenderia fasciculata]|eukprot:XP_004367083.1 guanine nucleotide binding protein 3 [Cavenderia fasciculata]